MELVLMRVTFTFNREFPGLGQKIKELREASSKSLTLLAAEAGISVTHWNRIENERVQYVPIETLRGIEKALGTNLGVKYEDEEQKISDNPSDS
ncbi:transcriptional regulator [Nostoc sp. 'Peltigera membranacea cyanobiont' 232]|nr:transcriptional regulator [Nostoc sp. 'Peltigera membranacea cyanobiont' 232]